MQYVYMYIYIYIYIYMYVCICVCMYVRVYVTIVNPTIEIVNGQTERTNCCRRKYLFHIVVKSLTGILYRSISSGDICSNEENVR